MAPELVRGRRGAQDNAPRHCPVGRERRALPLGRDRAQRDERRIDRWHRASGRSPVQGSRTSSDGDRTASVPAGSGRLSVPPTVRSSVAVPSPRTATGVGAGRARSDVDQLGERAVQMHAQRIREARSTPSCPPRVARVCWPTRRSMVSTAIRSSASVSDPGAASAMPSTARHHVERAQVDAAANPCRIGEPPGAACRRRQLAGQVTCLLSIARRDQRADLVVLERDLPGDGIAGAVDDLQLARCHQPRAPSHPPSSVRRRPAIPSRLR